MDQTQRKPVFFIVSSKLIFVVFCFMGLMYILIHEIITVIIDRQVLNGRRSILLCLRLYAAQRGCYFIVLQTDHWLLRVVYYFQDKATTKQGTIYGEIGSAVTLRLETGMSITEETSWLLFTLPVHS